MSPLDLSVEKSLRSSGLWQMTLKNTLKNTHMPAMTKDLLLYSMNQAHVPVSALKLP